MHLLNVLTFVPKIYVACVYPLNVIVYINVTHFTTLDFVFHEV